MPDVSFLVALLQAKADGDDDTVAELTEILQGDPEEAEALLEDARGGDKSEAAADEQPGEDTRTEENS